MKARKMAELEVVTKDKAGVLATVCRTLTTAKVNIEAMCGYACGGTAWLMIVADKAPRALAALKKAGLKVTRHDVLMVEMSNKVGALAAAGEKINRAGISLEYLYATTCGGKSRVVMGTKNMAKLVKALR